MQIVAFKREQEQHRLHIKRIRETRPMLDSSTPESLGLKHLAVRPKKQQLIEDKRQMVAKENAKLMSGMTKIMNEKRLQPKHVVPASLNEVERKKEVDRMNFENNLMLQRLNKIGPTLSKAQLEADFQKHLHAEANLRRRQMKPLSLPKDMYRVKEHSTTFDASTYASQHDSFGAGSGVLQQEFDSPIQSMSEFRQQVIATKKAAGLQQQQRPGGPNTGTLNSSGTLANAGVSTILKSQREISVHRNEPLFELSHQPS